MGLSELANNRSLTKENEGLDQIMRLGRGVRNRLRIYIEGNGE